MADVNIAWKRGDSYIEDLTFTAAGGGVFNLTGASLRWTLKASVEDPDVDAVIVHTIGDGIEVAVPASGNAVHEITAAEMATLVPGTTYRYDLQVTDSLGRVKTPMEGNLTVTADVSRDVP